MLAPTLIRPDSPADLSVADANPATELDFRRTPVFFRDKQAHFFRPFNRRSRELFAASVIAIYERLYGPEAVFTRAFDREALTDVIDRALAGAPRDIPPCLGDEPVEVGDLDAAHIIRELDEFGWLESYTDSASVKRVWRLTMLGKKFARALWEAGRPLVRTRQRNMRSCAAALENYVARGDVDDLIDAQSYAESVLEDLSSAIEHMRTAMRETTRTTNLRTVAVEEFRAFLIERFRKEHAPGLTADSAVRLKSRITESLQQLYALPLEKVDRYEADLQDRLVAVEHEERGGRRVYRIAERIERLVQNAVDAKMPELLGTFETYMSRMTSLVRQTSAGAGASDDPVRLFLDTLRDADDETRDRLLNGLAQELSTSRVRLYEPRDFRFEIEAQQVLVEAVPVDQEPTLESVVEAEVSRRFEDLLLIDEVDVVGFVLDSARGHGGRVKLSDLPLQVARDLLLALSAQVIVLSTPEVPLRVRPLARQIENEFFETTDLEFILEARA